jgi:hypothetical protein
LGTTAAKASEERVPWIYAELRGDPGGASRVPGELVGAPIRVCLLSTKPELSPDAGPAGAAVAFARLTSGV